MLSVNDEITLVEILVIVLGFGITWVVYYHSDRAELPGESTEPDPTVPDETFVPEGRTLE